MRKAYERIDALYRSSPLFQDLLETAIGTGVITAGQALATDMTPEELAIAAAVSFGSGMVGRPLLGPVGGYVGRQVNKRLPTIYREAFENGVKSMYDMPVVGAPMKAKLEAYGNMSMPEAYGNLIGRGYGDNVAQALAGLAMPQLFKKEDEEQ